MQKEKKIFVYGQDFLTAGIALEIARGACQGILSDETRIKVINCNETVQNIVNNGKAVYGINTGFGPLCTTKISEEQTSLLQMNILQSHSVGVGDPIDDEIAKLMMILKVHSLAKGYSGISIEVLERIIWHINHDAIPIVPSQGSVGASGDLAPLSHLFLPLIGLGKISHKGEIKETNEILKRQDLSPLVLGAKEGLALINGTQFIAAHAIKVVEKFHQCLSHADIVGAMMIEGLQGSFKPFMEELHQLRPFAGNIHVAARMRALLSDSEIMKDHVNCQKVQDPYSLRCIPQVHGASRNAWLHLKELLEVELNAVTDNPVIINDELTISGGNFHGQPLAMALDYACLAASEIGNISDRRIYLSLEGNSEGVPKLLMKDTGVCSGYMILQYTTAALASENKGLCFPSSADSIPTSLGQEDHVSMGSIGGRKALTVLGNVEKILAIELLTAAQAFEFRKPLKSGVILDEIHQLVRSKVAFAAKDRVFADDIEEGISLIKSGEILRKTTDVATKYQISLKTNYSDLLETY